MKRSYFFTVLVIVIAVISIVILAIKLPEESSVTSEDGLVTISGLARQSQQFTITDQESEDSNILTGSIYDLGPSTVALEEPARISFKVDGSKFDAQTQVYQFDSELSIWNKVDRIVKRTPDSMTVEVDQLGFFTLGTDTPLLDLPDFDDQFLSILELAPQNTVGYQMAVAYDFGLGPLIQVSETITGGCGGLVEIGNSEEISQVEYLSYSIIARWFVSDLAGCQDHQSLRSSF